MAVPVTADDYAEYYDQAFLDRLELRDLRTPLKNFWSAGCPRRDGLARTRTGKVILVEAKAYIEEAVDYRSRASLNSVKRINGALAKAKAAFGANRDAPWESPFYQYTNRLAHLYYLTDLNGVDAYLVFLYFAGAPDVPEPCAAQQWEGAHRLTQKCLGLGMDRFQSRIGHLILGVKELLPNRTSRSIR